MIFKSRKQAKNYTDGKDWTVYPNGVHCYYKDLPMIRYIKNRVNKYWVYFKVWSGLFDINSLIINLKKESTCEWNGMGIWFCYKCWKDISNYEEINHKNHNGNK